MDDECPHARRLVDRGKGKADIGEEERSSLLEHLAGACAGCAIAKRDPLRSRYYDLGRIALEVDDDLPATDPLMPLMTELRSDPPPAPDRTDELIRRTFEAIARNKKAQT